MRKSFLGVGNNVRPTAEEHTPTIRPRTPLRSRVPDLRLLQREIYYRVRLRCLSTALSLHGGLESRGWDEVYLDVSSSDPEDAAGSVVYRTSAGLELPAAGYVGRRTCWKRATMCGHGTGKDGKWTAIVKTRTPQTRQLGDDFLIATTRQTGIKSARGVSTARTKTAR